MSQGSSIQLQKSIKDNSEEVQDFLADLHRWENDIKDLEEKLSPSEEATQKDLPPVRCRESEMTTKKIITDNKRRKDEETKKKKKERISSYDYAAWDKFAADKALDSAEEEEEEEASSQDASSKRVTSTTRSSGGGNMVVPSLDKKERAIKLKDEGNKSYNMGRLEEAVAKYTRGMALDPTNAILPANRAMAYIKLEQYEAAEQDCSRCLKIDDAYIKAYLRRGTARLKLQKLKLAAEDFNKVLELEPWNKDAKRELEEMDTRGKKEANHCDTEAQKNQKNSDKSTSHCVKENISLKNATEERETEKKSMDLNSLQKNKKELVNEKSKKEHGKKIKIMEIDSSQSQPTSGVAKEDSETVIPIDSSQSQPTSGVAKEDSETVIPIDSSQSQPMSGVAKEDSETVIPIDSSQSQPTSGVAKDDSETVIPIDKLPHLRSQKALKRIEVIDVPSEDSIPKQLLSSTVLKDSEIKEIAAATKSPAKANVPKENTQKPPEKTPAKSPASVPLPAVPRTSHQFSQDWQRLAHHQPRAVEYLKAIPPSFFQGADLEADMFMELMSALRWDDFTPEQSVAYLRVLAQSDGYNVNVMFLDSRQKKVIYEVLEKCKDEENSNGGLFEKIKTSLL